MVAVGVVLDDTQTAIDGGDLPPMRHTTGCVLLNCTELEGEASSHDKLIRTVVVEVADLLQLQSLIILVDRDLQCNPIRLIVRRVRVHTALLIEHR